MCAAESMYWKVSSYTLVSYKTEYLDEAFIWEHKEPLKLFMLRFIWYYAELIWRFVKSLWVVSLRGTFPQRYAIKMSSYGFSVQYNVTVKLPLSNWISCGDWREQNVLTTQFWWGWKNIPSLALNGGFMPNLFGGNGSSVIF